MKEAVRPILLVEDNQDDVFIMQRALRVGKITNPLQVVMDGREAISYLSGQDKYADRAQYPLPFIFFLDLKLPYVSGFDVLSWIRQQAALEDVVVVVLTSSGERRDQDQAYALGARSYLVKPPNAEGLSGIFESLQSHWLSKSNVTPVASIS